MKLDVIAFGAHPDDVELTCAGTLINLIQRGYRVGIIALTAGESGTRGSRRIRRKEFETAAQVIGAQATEILNLPDGQLTNLWEQKVEVIHVLRRFRPRIIFAPYWEDRHPDHANASRIIQEASYLSGLKRIDTGQAAHRPVRVLYYASRYEFKPSFVVDVTPYHDQKLEAIRVYQSQFDSSEPAGEETNISHPGFLNAIIARARQYGSYIGVEFAEPFLVREPLKLDDPVAFFGPGYAKSFV
jgi:bacillithiol biosynthesis deacetylase BshB1